jgi:hypothetical protein
VQQAHRDPRATIGHACAVNGADRRVIEARGETGLALEARARRRVAQERPRQELERHRAPQLPRRRPRRPAPCPRGPVHARCGTLPGARAARGVPARSPGASSPVPRLLPTPATNRERARGDARRTRARSRIATNAASATKRSTAAASSQVVRAHGDGSWRHRTSPKRRTDALQRAREALARCGGLDAQLGGRFFVGELLEVPQHEHLAVELLELLERMTHALAQFLAPHGFGRRGVRRGEPIRGALDAGVQTGVGASPRSRDEVALLAAVLPQRRLQLLRREQPQPHAQRVTLVPAPLRKTLRRRRQRLLDDVARVEAAVEARADAQPDGALEAGERDWPAGATAPRASPRSASASSAGSDWGSIVRGRGASRCSLARPA